MSLTSYRAAPPRVEILRAWSRVHRNIFALGRPGSDLLSRVLRHSTIGAEGFHGRVRDGIGCLAPRCGHQAGKACPRNARPCSCPAPVLAKGASLAGGCPGVCHVNEDEVSVGRVGRVLPLHAAALCWFQAPIERLVPVSCAGCPASTSGLSTWWSSTALQGELV